ncbi:MAG TPA: 3',5'-cyclic-nucleotide phosphodiesterase [Deltaproteobacteria bacterium]|nr:3',5'-cyclic-nucleotide phosphodiesterase [Deltaproteobacteria bacterium]
MKITILGCSGSVTPGYNTTSILINGHTLIDAGSAASVLTEKALSGIRTILLTHSHIDHIKELPFIIDTLYSLGTTGTTIWGSEKTIEALKTHVFNGLIWPDMKELDAEEGFVRLKILPSSEIVIENITVQAVSVDHIAGSVGYILSDNGNKVFFSGDAGYQQSMFERIGHLGDDLKALFIEVSFPDRMQHIAKVSRHLTPGSIRQGIKGRVGTSTRVIAYHIKPKHLEEVISELSPEIEYIVGGEEFTF